MQKITSWLSRRAINGLTILLAVALTCLGSTAIASPTPVSAQVPAQAKVILVAVADSPEVTVANETAAVVPEAGEEHEVKMGSDSGLLAFIPKSLTIKPGDTVEWVINKAPPHNVMFDTAGLDSDKKELIKKLPKPKLLATAGSTYTVTFPSDTPPGRYPYFCTPHRGAGMVGEIIVEEATS